MEALTRGFGYVTASPVQAQAIPIAMQGIDVLARAKTGTGKTLAFLIPAFEQIARMQAAPGKIRCLVISPTRELATQIAVEGKTLAQPHGFKIQTVMGGKFQSAEQKRLKAGCELLVATPGRLQDHLDNSPGFKASLGQLAVLILDEADQLLEMGFKKEIEKILRSLPPPSTRQTLLFSATVTPQVQQIAQSALRPGKNQAYCDCISKGEDHTHAKVPQYQMVVPMSDLIQTFVSLIELQRKDPTHKVIVFFATARCTQFFAELFCAAGIPVLDIHSRKSQSQRTKASDQFRKAKSAVLFSSDVSARGMDYPDVSYVLQVGCASSREQYVHRIGRSGRAGKSGEAMLLLCDFEAFFLRDQTYQAWLGFYKGLLRKIGWKPHQLVSAANELSRLIGLSEPPALLARTIGKMGLRGTPGLRSK
eukprot:gene9051-23845_t